MKKYLIILSGFILLMILTNCSNDEMMDYCSIEEKIENDLIPEELEILTDLPEWLVNYIEEYKGREYKDIGIKNEGVYQFSWRGEIFYFHNRPYRLVFMDYIFSSDGTRMELTTEEREDIEINAKDLKLIYRFSRVNQNNQR